LTFVISYRLKYVVLTFWNWHLLGNRKWGNGQTSSYLND
jgi:hypothetical protein